MPYYWDVARYERYQTSPGPGKALFRATTKYITNVTAGAAVAGCFRPATFSVIKLPTGGTGWRWIGTPRCLVMAGDAGDAGDSEWSTRHCRLQTAEHEGLERTLTLTYRKSKPLSPQAPSSKPQAPSSGLVLWRCTLLQVPFPSEGRPCADPFRQFSLGLR